MLRGFILLLFIISFFCGIASLFGNDWASIRLGGKRTSSLGLWMECVETNVTAWSVPADLCRGYNLAGDNVETRVLLTRWIAVGGLAIGTVTFLLLILAVREDALDEEEKGNTCSSNFLIVFWLSLQSLALIAAMAAYSHYFVNDLKDMSYTLGWSYALGWASAGVYLMSACILTLGACVSGNCRCSDDDE